jgi:acylphosphatase
VAAEHVHLSIRGVVQGVGYRYQAQAEATRLGLAGWVRNRRDGSVETFAEGSAEAVEAFASWCRHGPRGAHVSEVAVLARGEAARSGSGGEDGFAIRPTE